ncbi:class E sortase [Streptomyces cremeus]|uniref:Class E sortase n=1 Tax=Streptomyces cremeus TaxID=66881 RepID=A0ABV5P8N5_STRCM
MTALRPEHDAAGYGVPQEGYGHAPGEGYDPRRQVYGAQEDLGAAVDRLADPLNDPLPGTRQQGWGQEAPGGRDGAYGAYSGHQEPQQEWYDPQGYRRDWYGEQQAPAVPPQPEAPYAPYATSQAAAYAPPQPDVSWAPPQDAAYAPSPDALHAPREPVAPVPPQQVYAPEQQTYVPPQQAYEAEPQQYLPEREFAPEPVTGPDRDGGGGASESVRTGGRAERRRSAKGRAPTGTSAGASAGKESTGVVVSRFVGELFITFGVVMLLFVTYQLWWTNVRAGMQADGAAHSLQDGWAKAKDGAKPAGAFEPGQGFAIMHIPKLDVKVPVAEGIDKHKVLDRGMVGHYADGGLKTAMPGDKQGNFAVAGHRNTHGEPFRYVNKLVKGDKIVVETQDTFYTYEMTSMLPQTSPSNVGVIQPVPPGSGFTGPGRYITLTTCTPEFTSTYRLIVWGKMVEERPRSKGMPKALDG